MTNYSSDYVETKQIEFDKTPPIIKVAFLDVGQGDTIVVSCPTTSEAIVVDCTDANSVLDYLEQEQIAYLRTVIITHLHEDHYREVATLLKNYSLAVGTQTCEVLAFNEVVDRKNRQVLIQDADEHSSHYSNPLGRRPALTSYSSLLRWRDQEENKSNTFAFYVHRQQANARHRFGISKDSSFSNLTCKPATTTGYVLVPREVAHVQEQLLLSLVMRCVSCNRASMFIVSLLLAHISKHINALSKVQDSEHWR